MHTRFSRAAAILAIAALTACGGGGLGGPSAPGTPGPIAPPAPASGGMLVGIGDSLTAGYQSSGFLGDPSATSPLSSYPGNVVPPGQFSGFWADMFNQMTGTPNSAAAVLPLIKAPGLADQIVIDATPPGPGLPPPLFANTHLACDTFNQAAYSSSAWQSVRLNPTGGVADLGVPGITMHEAVSMTGPLTGPTTPNGAGTACNGYPAIPGDPTSGGLQSLVTGESEMYYPVLGGFQGLGAGHVTELSAALSLNPKLTTVWLGANDLLKFSFSGGLSPVTDSPAQLGTDLTQIVNSLKAAGSKVLVADLPDVLTTPQFFPQAKLSADLQSLGIPAPAAAAIVSYVGTQYGVTAGGYLTESGFLSIAQACASGAATCLTPQLDGTPAVKGSGLGGNYLTPAFAAEVQALNTGYNQVIDQIASNSGTTVALVPVHTVFTQIIAAGGYTVAGTPFPPFTFNFGGGLLSWDGLHPSNLGYALIANAFIGTADTAFGMAIPPLSASQIANIAINDPYDSYAIKTVNPQWPFPLP
ncbi:MAG TPA: SGNH/GDSL hydrolase family protein [Candidatus Aquilonibacter sp.]|nr:SGNH/GDSL hydrolase family protein [Candidatus Aquilonibacter sp.]